MQQVHRGHFDRDQSVYRFPIDQILSSLYAYEQGLVKIILGDQGSLVAKSTMEVIEHEGKSIKIEGMEKMTHELQTLCDQLAEAYQHYGPVTCHLFIAPMGSESFPTHTDPDDVMLLVVDGMKHIAVAGEEIELMQGEFLFIPAGTPHRAINRCTSRMLSIGLEKFIVDKL